MNSAATLISLISAIGSAGSLLGFAAYVWLMLLNRRDEEDVRREEQAQGLSAWLDEGDRHDREEDWVVCVHNNGVAPVFQLRLRFRLPSVEREGALELAVLPPGVLAVRQLPMTYDDVDRDELFSAAAVPDVTFTDSHGGHWSRDQYGRLRRLDRRRLRRRPLLADRRGRSHWRSAWQSAWRSAWQSRWRPFRHDGDRRDRVG